jgi:hypothetical protein
LTSEANLLTDAPGQEGMSPTDGATDVDMMAISEDQLAVLLSGVNPNVESQQPTQITASGRSGFSDAVSTHTRGTGAADSPIRLDFDGDLGSTRRLLFPSPKQQKDRSVLGEVSANISPPGPAAGSESRDDKDFGAEEATATVITDETMDDLEHLFRTPAPNRPSTPPPKVGLVFKTPSRTTPSHRPVTRSISRSMRSVQSSPSFFKTSSRTPGSAAKLMIPESPTLRRSPRINGPSGMKSVDRERRLREAVDGLCSDSDFMRALGSAMHDPLSDQAELDAILDKCLNNWGEFTPRRGVMGGDVGHMEWNLEQLDEHFDGPPVHI